MPEISEGFDPAGLEKLSMLDLAGQVIKQASTTPTAAAPSQIQAGVLHAQDTGDDMMKYHFNALKSGRGIFG
jgi:hypothetical protein